MIERHMRRVLIAAAFCVLLPTIAFAQSMGLGLGIASSVPSSGVGCSQATAWNTRAGLSGALATNYQNMICGMVTDGTWALMYGIWMLATNTTTTANLNLVSTNFTLTVNGTETFAANNGYTGDASTGYFDTGLNPAGGGNYTQNSGALGSCVLSSRTTSQVWASIGNSNFATYAYTEPLGTGSLVAYELNSGVFQSLAASNAQGSLIVSRTSSSAIALYKNGSSVATPADTSTGLANENMFVGAYNLGGTASANSGDQIAYAFVSGGLTPTQASNVYSRLHTFLVAVGAASGC